MPLDVTKICPSLKTWERGREEGRAGGFSPSVLFFPRDARGGPRIFFGRGCTTKEWHNRPVTGRKQILIANTKKKAGHLRGGGVRTPCTLPLDPPLDASLIVSKYQKCLLAQRLT